LLCDLTDLGVPVGSELLDTISPQFISDLISWGAIGARTTESQLHRELASGVSFPIGFKNGTDGSMTVAVDAMHSASNPHAFMGVTEQGLAAIVKTRGNQDVHVILRGGTKGPNYSEEHVRDAVAQIEKARKGKGFASVMVDCSHGNSQKNHLNQPKVLASLITQLRSPTSTHDYVKHLTGVMIESHIHAGRQDVPAESEGGAGALKWGVSITDACVCWEMTVDMLDGLNEVVDSRLSLKLNLHTRMEVLEEVRSRSPGTAAEVGSTHNLPDVSAPQQDAAAPSPSAAALVRRLSILDRLLTPSILVCMIVGVVIGEFVPNVQHAFDTVQFKGVSVPIAIGLIIMMWPVLTKVQYESLPTLFTSRKLLLHILISLFLNWLLAPFIMLALAWATLPDLPTYRTGVILVGLARCIAMVMVWNQLAGGDKEYCAVLVVMNSGMQMVLYSPYAIWFVNVIGGASGQDRIHVSYGEVAVSVLIYLGIPLALGLTTRTLFLSTPKTRTFFHHTFLPFFSPISLIGLLYTILVMFAYQGHHILSNLRPVFRVFVPLILYFAIVWVMGFSLIYWLGQRSRDRRRYAGMCACKGLDTTYPPEKPSSTPLTPSCPPPHAPQQPEPNFWGYDMAVVQAFTAGSNNFELAIAVAIAVYGVGSDQALAATIGPLVEVPVLLGLTWVALWLGKRLDWEGSRRGLGALPSSSP
ncbi:hypothetical protein EIP91_009234, partial [Steccherinum ochraceum]